MAKKLKKIFLLIPILIISTFSIHNVKAEELPKIYTLSNTLPALSDISNTSLGNYTSINFSNLFNYNYTFQLNSSTQNLDNWLLLYNRQDNYYVLFIIDPRYLPADTSDKYFVLNSTGLGIYNNLTGAGVISNNVKPFFFGIYNDSSTNGLIAEDFNTTFGNYKNLDNFYICQKNNYFQNFTSDFYSLLASFDYIDSSFDYYINYELQTRYTPEEPEGPTPPEPPVIEENLDKIFVPNYKEGKCVEILDKDTLRVFENENTNIYIDYYINSHYISKEGQTEVNYSKHCSTREFTSIGYYRNDFPEILFITGTLCLFSIGFVFILFKRFRKR